jgi:hypothetical protein
MLHDFAVSIATFITVMGSVLAHAIGASVLGSVRAASGALFEPVNAYVFC